MSSIKQHYLTEAELNMFASAAENFSVAIVVAIELSMRRAEETGDIVIVPERLRAGPVVSAEDGHQMDAMRYSTGGAE